MEQIRNRLKGMGLQDSTIKTYISILNQFFEHTRKASNFTEEEINNYLDYLIIKKGYSARSRNLHAKVIRFYCREFENKQIEIRKAKENKPIPKICWDDDFTQIISVTPNIKHRLCLLLMRYSGLRRWEVIRVMKHHIQQDGKLFVKSGKGDKDRFTILPEQVYFQLKAYIELLPAENPYIFQGQNSKYYSKRTPQAILKNAFIRLNWHRSRWFGCHALRHAFVVWALDNKIGDYDQVSKWVGHSIRQTTQIYTQCRKTDYSEAVEKCKTIGIIA
ncbi:tyrosine-type recombinase/integrase [Candidatus Pacearchaeota archaeon]|nr:tyrosine-type recombinase/integrase [Candidatus Pacearchaeota archaeon]